MNSNLANKVALTTFATLSGMTIFELVKLTTFPWLTAWQSHTVTILFGTIVATGFAYLVYRDYDRLYRKALLEMSDRKSAQSELRKTHLELERRVSQRTRELSEANTALRQALFERERLSTELEAKEEQYRGVFRASSDGLAVLDPEGRLVEVNPEGRRLLGRRQEALGGTRFIEAVHADDRGVVHEALAGLGSRLAFEAELRLVGHQQRVAAVELSFVSFLYKGSPHMLAIFRDVTRRLAAEGAQRASEERFRQLAENINEIFYLVDWRSGKLEYLSPAFEKVWGGVPPAQGNPLEDAIHPEDREGVREAFIEKATDGTYEAMYRIVRPDGELRWIRDRAFPIVDAHGLVYRIAGLAEDITEQRALEDGLRQAQRMEAIGNLAGGIAHDFNNLLQAITGNLKLVGLGDAEARRRYVDQALEASKRAADITRQLLAFGRQQRLELTPVDLNEAVSEAGRLLGHLLGDHIELALDQAALLPPIEADRAQLVQVIVNLAVNARDAMPRGGRIDLGTSLVQDAGVGHVVLLVRDQGCGIAPELQQRIFDPFLTTKEEGKGTGLGLATVYGIVDQCGGGLSLESAVGLGSTFRVRFPVVASEKLAGLGADLSPSKRMPELADLSSRGDETVLVVEDDDSVRSLVREVMELSGYRVLSAASGGEALARAECYSGRIDLLLTDMVMPGMSGQELACALADQRPETKVLYSSGYFAEDLVDSLDVLHKPYLPDVLAARVRLVLDEGLAIGDSEARPGVRLRPL